MILWAAACGLLLPTLPACQSDDPTTSPLSDAASESNDPPPSDSAVDDGETRFPDAPERPLPTVWFEPADLTTAFDATSFQVWVNNLTRPVGEQLLTELAASVSLVTWPELARLPILVSSIVDASGRSGEDQFAHIYLNSPSQLADRWYAIAVEALPEDAAWPLFENSLILSDGARVHRFRVGSEPIVASVRYYGTAKDQDDSHAVQVFFSENVIGDIDLIQLSYSGGEPFTIRPNGGIVNGEAPLICQGAIDTTRELELVVQPGIRSTSSGLELNGGAPVRIPITPDSWYQCGYAWEDGYLTFRAPDP